MPSDSKAGERGQDRHRKADGQRHARAVHDARVDVAPEHVGAKPEFDGGVARALGGRERRRVDGAEIGSQQRDQQHEDQQGRAEGDGGMAIDEA